MPFTRNRLRHTKYETPEKKWETIKTLVPEALITMNGSRMGVLYYGTTALPMPEALDLLRRIG